MHEKQYLWLLNITSDFFNMQLNNRSILMFKIVLCLRQQQNKQTRFDKKESTEET